MNSPTVWMRLPVGPRLFRESETGARQKYAGGCPAVMSTLLGVAIDRATIVRFKPGRTSRPPSSTCTIPAAPAPGLLSAASRLNRKPSRGRKKVIPPGRESAQLTQLRPSIVTPHRRRDRLCGARRRAGASAQASAAGDAIAQLVRYLPTELVAAYTTVVGVLPLPGGDPVCNGEFTARWIALAIFVVLDADHASDVSTSSSDARPDKRGTDCSVVRAWCCPSRLPRLVTRTPAHAHHLLVRLAASVRCRHRGDRAFALGPGRPAA